MKKPKLTQEVLQQEIERLQEQIKELRGSLNDTNATIGLWQRRARETLDILHAFSAPTTQVILRSWNAGL